MHHEVLTAAARARKHIFVEKVLAPTLRECNDIVREVEQADITLVVALFRMFHGYTEAIRGVIERGELGDITQVRVRLSHNGAIRTPESPEGWLAAHFFNKPETVGGALIDLGCHPMYLARHFGGMPRSVTSSFGYVTRREVEDNAVAVLDYESGAKGIVEAGFVNRFSPFTVEVHGTEGSLLYGTPEPKLYIKSAKLGAERSTPWTVLDLPPDRHTPFEHWVELVNRGEKDPDNIRLAVDLTVLMEAATLSAERGAAVRLDELQQ